MKKRTARIKYLAAQIVDLTSELNSLLALDNEHISSSDSTSSLSRSPRIGDFVRITNTYRGHFNETGVVVSVSASFLDVRLDSGRSVVTKLYASVEIIR